MQNIWFIITVVYLVLCVNLEAATTSTSYYTQLIKDTACNGQNGTCSPNWCTRAPNAACVDPLNGNVISTTGGPIFACKVCTPAPVTKCSASFLNSVIIKSGGFLGAYCNDEYLIIVSTGKASHTSWLSLIPHPPASGSTPYEQSCVTRTYHQQSAMFKVPIYPELLDTADPSNNLAYFAGQDDPANIPLMGLPESGPAAVSVSGLSIFPLYNNMKQIAMSSCEVDTCNAHAGQGFDYHYHGDPYHPTAGTCMYSPADYANASVHPPQVGWALDGFFVFGRHLSVSNLGYGVALDRCGGHAHSQADGTTAMEYHYHTQVINATAPNGKLFLINSPGVLDCFRGNFTKNRHFFDNSVPAGQRADVDLLRPCCGQTEYVVDKGFVINGMVSKAPTQTPTRSPTTEPTLAPSVAPTTTKPSVSPTLCPSVAPSVTPTLQPSIQPTTSISPSVCPTTVMPTTLKPSAVPTLSPTGLPSESPSLNPTALPTTTAPSQVPSLVPSTVPSQIPSLRPVTRSPSTTKPTTHHPTLTPTLAPSYQKEPVVKFSADITLVGMSSATLDALSVSAIVTATAQSMDISESYVSFLGSQTVGNSRRLKGSGMGLLAVTVTASTAIEVPLINYAAGTDPAALYLTLKGKLDAATGSSAIFVGLLTNASALNGAIQTFGVTSASAVVHEVSIVAAPSFAPSAGPQSDSSGLAVGAIVGIAIGGACLLLLVAVGAFFLIRRSSSVDSAQNNGSISPSISSKDPSTAEALALRNRKVTNI